MKLRILFVDDEPHVLQGMQRMMRSMRQEWEIITAGGANLAHSIWKGRNSPGNGWML